MKLWSSLKYDNIMKVNLNTGVPYHNHNDTSSVYNDEKQVTFLNVTKYKTFRTDRLDTDLTSNFCKICYQDNVGVVIQCTLYSTSIEGGNKLTQQQLLHMLLFVYIYTTLHTTSGSTWMYTIVTATLCWWKTVENEPNQLISIVLLCSGKDCVLFY